MTQDVPFPGTLEPLPLAGLTPLTRASAAAIDGGNPGVTVIYLGIRAATVFAASLAAGATAFAGGWRAAHKLR